MRRAAHRGAVLIVVLGVLAVLSLLAVAFAQLQALERTVSMNYLDCVRARLVARGGIDQAVDALRYDFPSNFFEQGRWVYYGDDLSGDAVHEPDETALRAVDVETGTRPSYPLCDSGGSPRLLTIEGVSRAVSGTMGSSAYGLHADAFRVRVQDATGLIYVNDGVLDGNDSSVSQNLKRILNALGRIVGVADLGTTLVVNRPREGFRTDGEISALLGDDYHLVEPYLTLHAWTDSVANPVPLSASVLPEYPVTYSRGAAAVYRYGGSGKWKDADGAFVKRIPAFFPSAAASRYLDPQTAVYDWTELNPQWIEIVRRAPVNVNSAPREVLTALLAGLEGFYLTDRRRNRPPATQGGAGPLKYGGFLPTYSFSSAPGLALWDPTPRSEGDEVGFLYRTVTFLLPAESRDGVPAENVADEIIACREKKKSTATGFDYAGAPFGGPFRSWAQFYAFCDHLASSGVLTDPRPIFFDYNPASADALGYYGAMVDSPIQRKRAVQALADVLKANFNPNLHLNELNPDANMHLLVDKTDLIVNSTEFCFVPMGYVKVQSVGMVLRPIGDADDAFAAADNEVVARARIQAVVKLYDVYRESTQKKFAGGSLPARKGPGSTAWGKALEIGPEPANGPAPGENEWGGYVALPTLGAIDGMTGPSVAPVPTPTGTAEMGERLHAHFQLDMRAHHSALGQREELCRATVAGGGREDCFFNEPFWTESLPGPYDPAWGPPGRHRMARSFTKKALDSGLAPFSYAPSNLRLDGAYTGVHSAISYYTRSQNPAMFSGFASGAPEATVSFWYKPAYDPELTGKLRTLWSYSRLNVQQKIFLLFLPTHSASPDGLVPTSYAGYYSGYALSNMPSASMIYGAGVHHTLRMYYFARFGFCKLTQSLNHGGHSDAAAKRNALAGHRWTHVVLQWRLTDYSSSRLLIDGQNVVKYDWSNTRGTACRNLNLEGTARTDMGGSPVLQNHIRFGTPSYYLVPSRYYECPNASADGTLDEIVVWDGNQTAVAQSQWSKGRYYKPARGEAVFTSAAIELPASSRSLPPPSVAAPEDGMIPPPPAAPSASGQAPVEILGISWTWFGEESVDGGAGKLARVCWDYNLPLPNKPLYPAEAVPVSVKMAVDSGNASTPWLEDDGVSSVDLTWTPGTPLKYRVSFELAYPNLSSILLATPYLDDVTIYCRSGVQFVAYMTDSRSP